MLQGIAGGHHGGNDAVRESEFCWLVWLEAGGGLAAVEEEDAEGRRWLAADGMAGDGMSLTGTGYEFTGHYCILILILFHLTLFSMITVNAIINLTLQCLNQHPHHLISSDSSNRYICSATPSGASRALEHYR